MRFIVDAQLPPALAEWLRERGHQAAACRDLGLRDADDRSIWERAGSDRAIIITKDEDFAILAGSDRQGRQVLWVRTGNLVNRVLLAQFARAWPQVEGHLLAGVAVVELR
ncbi:MAG: DUF5615 family PIN-like protein [Pseudomonadota bacterium]|nr:DUF5615 family PIN-like protein [Pseudomonadota bacterium]